MTEKLGNTEQNMPHSWDQWFGLTECNPSFQLCLEG